MSYCSTQCTLCLVFIITADKKNDHLIVLYFKRCIFCHYQMDVPVTAVTMVTASVTKTLGPVTVRMDGKDLLVTLPWKRSVVMGMTMTMVRFK